MCEVLLLLLEVPALPGRAVGGLLGRGVHLREIQVSLPPGTCVHSVRGGGDSDVRGVRHVHDDLLDGQPVAVLEHHHVRLLLRLFLPGGQRDVHLLL